MGKLYIREENEYIKRKQNLYAEFRAGKISYEKWLELLHELERMH